MYTTVIGRTFLDEYNRRNQTNLSAKQLFENELFKVIFDHPKYLMWAQNSPFVQGIGKKKPFLTPQERQDRLLQLHVKITGGERDASIALGYPASSNKEFATTSGLLTDLPIDSEDEQIYLSWLGATLSVGIAGGYSILFNHPQICYDVFEGWQVYRSLLEDPAIGHKFSPNKLITWNGQWLSFRYSKYYRPGFRLGMLLNMPKMFSQDPDSISINTIPWSQLFFALSSTYSNQALLTYIYGLGQTNKTIGFIPFHLKEGRLIREVCQQLMSQDQYELSTQEFEALFGLHIKRACELGSIGMQALEPKNLRKYIIGDAKLKISKPNLARKAGETDEEYQSRSQKLREKDNENLLTFYAYKTWLIAMIAQDKTELSNYTREIAAALLKYRSSSRGNKGKNLIDTLFSKPRKENFLECLTEIVSDSETTNEVVETMNKLRDKAHFMSREDFAYFVTLLKFDYAYQERIA